MITGPAHVDHVAHIDHAELAQMDQLVAAMREQAPQWLSALPDKPGFSSFGKVARVLGTVIEAHMPPVQIGELCTLTDPESDLSLLAEVVGFNHHAALLSALSPLEGVSNRTRITPMRCTHSIEVGEHLLGCVLDGFGRMQFRTAIMPPEQPGWRDVVPVIRDAPAATDRPRITSIMPTGIRAIDGLLTLGRGQRIGVFAGAGCGKSDRTAQRNPANQTTR